VPKIFTKLRNSSAALNLHYLLFFENFVPDKRRNEHRIQLVWFLPASQAAHNNTNNDGQQARNRRVVQVGNSVGVKNLVATKKGQLF
jgi:hypothetical protein